MAVYEVTVLYIEEHKLFLEATDEQTAKEIAWDISYGKAPDKEYMNFKIKNLSGEE